MLEGLPFHMLALGFLFELLTKQGSGGILGPCNPVLEGIEP